jgi:hypothetical protein
MKRININTENENTDIKDKNEKETDKDDQDKDKDLVYVPENSRILWSSSWLFLGSSIYTVYNHHYDLVIVPGGLFLTSINYWRDPHFNSWQRTLDVNYIYFSFSYQLMRCYSAQYIVHFLLGLLVCLFLYKLSLMTFNYKMFLLSTLLHSSLHIFANLSILGLNSGYIEPFCDNKFTKVLC